MPGRGWGRQEILLDSFSEGKGASEDLPFGSETGVKRGDGGTRGGRNRLEEVGAGSARAGRESRWAGGCRGQLGPVDRGRWRGISGLPRGQPGKPWADRDWRDLGQCRAGRQFVTPGSVAARRLRPRGGGCRRVAPVAGGRSPRPTFRAALDHRTLSAVDEAITVARGVTLMARPRAQGGQTAPRSLVHLVVIPRSSHKAYPGDRLIERRTPHVGGQPPAGAEGTFSVTAHTTCGRSAEPRPRQVLALWAGGRRWAVTWTTHRPTTRGERPPQTPAGHLTGCRIDL